MFNQFCDENFEYSLKLGQIEVVLSSQGMLLYDITIGIETFCSIIRDIMKEHSQLTLAILDTLANLSLKADLLAEVQSLLRALLTGL